MIILSYTTGSRLPFVRFRYLQRYDCPARTTHEVFYIDKRGYSYAYFIYIYIKKINIVDVLKKTHDILI